MFRKLMIAVAASLSLLSPLALPTDLQAFEIHRHRHHDYRVYYRDCNHEPWRVYGTYRHREDAGHAIRHLRARGLEAFVR